MTTASLGFFERLVLAFGAFFRLLFDGRYAARVAQLSSAAEREAGAVDDALSPAVQPPAPAPGPAAASADSEAPALVLLGLLQGEGRFIDFLQQDLDGFDDAQIGAVARVVHGGCRKVLAQHVPVESIASEPEGGPVQLEAGFDASKFKLVGRVEGSGALRGVLRHRGWQARSVSLPRVVAGAPASVLCPAEIEL